VSLKVVW